MKDIDSKDELIRALLYESSLSGAIQVGLRGDTAIDDALDDEFEAELREILQ